MDVRFRIRPAALADAAALVAIERRCFSDPWSEVAFQEALYLARGFRPVGQRSSYYRNPREDALVLRLELHQHA